MIERSHSSPFMQISLPGQNVELGLGGQERMAFQTASALTRLLVLKASDTWLAISDSAGPLT
jgi:hypothetical protein